MDEISEMDPACVGVCGACGIIHDRGGMHVHWSFKSPRLGPGEHAVCSACAELAGSAEGAAAVELAIRERQEFLGKLSRAFAVYYDGELLPELTAHMYEYEPHDTIPCPPMLEFEE